ncbi:YybH family protein [Flagellimonas sp.]|uniref:YybH family protein n=1 Tax=Flagellimonas sp. TaxID=2058762 RepID=UPI003B59D1A3
MKKIVFLFLGTCLCFFGCKVSEEDDKAEIMQILHDQEEAWSNHDLEGFMQGYWKNDSLQFYGARGLTLGWDKTLSGYKERYPSKADTGSLKFTIDAVTKIDSNSYYVMGQYHLTREVGDANGVFLIVLRKINGEWKIVADMSC